MKIAGTYTPTKWNENVVEVIDGRMKLTKATMEYTFSGDIDGIAKVESLMFYSSFDPEDMHKSEASYIGQILMTGKVLGKSGSFVLNDSGTFEGGVAKSALSILPHSGTDELMSISGTGTYTADQNGCNWEMDISL